MLSTTERRRWTPSGRQPATGSIREVSLIGICEPTSTTGDEMSWAGRRYRVMAVEAPKAPGRPTYRHVRPEA